MLLFRSKHFIVLHLILFFIIAAAAGFTANLCAQPKPRPGAPIQLPGASGGPAIAFERSTIDFLSQGIEQENCINVSLSNRSDRPDTLTILESLDPKHFRINSPVQEMMPMVLEPHSSVYVNLCFKADKEKQYHAAVIAVSDADTAKLLLSGKGVKQKVQGPMPTMLDLKVRKGKNRIDRIFAIELPVRSTVTLEVQDVLGRTVRKLITNEIKSPGEYEVEYSWLDDDEKALPAATYLLRLEATSLETHEVSHASAWLKVKP